MEGTKTDSHNSNALAYEYAWRGDSNKLESLLKSDSRLIYAFDDVNGLSLLHWAANGGSIDCIRVLLKYGTNVDIRDLNDAVTSLHIAAARGFTHCVETLLQHGAETNALSKHLETPLHLACWDGHHMCVELLLSAGAMINAIDDKYGDCPLHCASRAGHLHALTTLLQSGAAVNIRNRKGQTALHCAAAHNRLDCFRLLVKYGADLTIRADDNKRVFSLFTKSSLKFAAIVRSEFSFEQLSGKSFELWFYLLRIDNIENVGQRIKYYAMKYPKLLEAIDGAGRTALDCASKLNKTILRGYFASPSSSSSIPTSLLWFGRFYVDSSKPLYSSSTSIIFKARDCRPQYTTDPSVGASNVVVIKLMRDRGQYIKEVSIRKRFELSSEFIVPIVFCCPSELDVDGSELDSCFGEYASEREEIGCNNANLSQLFVDSDAEQRKGMAESLYCCVMPFAVCSLTEYFSPSPYGSSGEAKPHCTVEKICADIFGSAGHLHERGLVHANINPDNVLFESGKWKLIDLKFMCRAGRDFIDCLPLDLSYVAPEGIQLYEYNFGLEQPLQENASPEKKHSRTFVVELKRSSNCPHSSASSSYKRASHEHLVRSGSESIDSGEHLVAHSSFDVWSLGCICYKLYSPLRACLLPQATGGLHRSEWIGVDPSQVTWDDRSLWTIYFWQEIVKIKKLSYLRQLEAANDEEATWWDKPIVRLLNQLLARDPSQRPPAQRILLHPLFSSTLANRSDLRLLNLRQLLHNTADGSMQRALTPRQVGEPPSFDVFISHRGERDEGLADLLYRLLSEKGLRVWWAKKSLLSVNKSSSSGRCANFETSSTTSSCGTNETDARSDLSKDWDRMQTLIALSKSSTYLPIISRFSINHPSNLSQNFEHLSKHSDRIDELLLEYRFAIEMLQSNLVEQIFPILVGDVQKVNDEQLFDSYFSGDCCPMCSFDIVDCVETEFIKAVSMFGLGNPISQPLSVFDLVQLLLSSSCFVLQGRKNRCVSELLESLTCLLLDARHRNRQLLLLAEHYGCTIEEEALIFDQFEFSNDSFSYTDDYRNANESDGEDLSPTAYTPLITPDVDAFIRSMENTSKELFQSRAPIDDLQFANHDLLQSYLRSEVDLNALTQQLQLGLETLKVQSHQESAALKERVAQLENLLSHQASFRGGEISVMDRRDDISNPAADAVEDFTVRAPYYSFLTATPSTLSAVLDFPYQFVEDSAAVYKQTQTKAVGCTNDMLMNIVYALKKALDYI